MKKFEMVCTGSRPLLLHNVRLASPLNPFAKELKRLNAPRIKTDEDRMAMARVEFEGGMYFDDVLGPFVPGGNLLASIQEGAKIKRGGKKVERGVTILEFELPLVYDGPRTIEGLWNDGDSDFIDLRPVKVAQSRVDRCRPIFRNWRIQGTAIIDESVLEEAEFRDFVELAGKMAGLGDFRKQYGRYDVEITDITGS